MIRGIKLVSIPVRNQDASLKFYTEQMGFKVATDQFFGPGQRWIELLIPGSDVNLALFTPEGHENRIGGFQTVTFWCDDVFATTETSLCSRAVDAEQGIGVSWRQGEVAEGSNSGSQRRDFGTRQPAAAQSRLLQIGKQTDANFAPRLNLPDVVLRLQAQPDLRRGSAECSGQAHCHLRRDGGLAVEHTGKGDPPNAQMPGRF